MFPNRKESELNKPKVPQERIKRERIYATISLNSFIKVGGARGDRTPDLYNAIVALSQLSYDPNDLDQIPKNGISQVLSIQEVFIIYAS